MQVMHLLSGVSVHGDQHLVEVERDLMQMDLLLDEAIKKLCASFMAIHHAVGQQQETLNTLLVNGNPRPEQVARLEALRSEINQHVGAAVTGLQFQDMTSQLIGRIGQHLTGLHDVFGALDTSRPDISGFPEGSMSDVLDRITDKVDACCTELASGVRSAVNQRHMESGDIELF